MLLPIIALAIGLIVSFTHFYTQRRVLTSGVTPTKPYRYFIYLTIGLLLYVIAPFAMTWFASIVLYTYEGSSLLITTEEVSSEKIRTLISLTGPFSILLLQAAGMCFMLSGGYKWLTVVGKVLATLAFVIYIPASVLVPLQI